MKLIEALKQSKDLTRKAEDLKQKVKNFHADYDIENPTYGSPEQQKEQISKWIQSYSDIVKEILSLRFRIQKTNIVTPVTISLGGNEITKTIAEWIHRRKDLAKMDAAVYDVLNDKGLAPVSKFQKTAGDVQETKIRRYYDPRTRDEKKEVFASEPSNIDARLEVVNAITDLLD